MPDIFLKELEKKDKFFSRKTAMHFFGYSLVGAVTNIIEIGFLFLLVEVFHFWYLIASIIVFTFGSMFSFTGRRIFVFKKKGFEKIRRQLASYIFIFLIGITINSFIMTFCVEVLNIYYALSYIIAVLISGFLGFLWNKKITFRD